MTSRLILSLRARGWSDTEIADFILWVQTGEERYRPALAELKEKEQKR